MSLSTNGQGTYTQIRRSVRVIPVPRGAEYTQRVYRVPRQYVTRALDLSECGPTRGRHGQAENSQEECGYA